MARYWQPGDPMQSEAICDPTYAAQLIEFDHHQVIVANLWGILLTYDWIDWMRLEVTPEPFIATVVFNPAPTHVTIEVEIRRVIRKHPVAPSAIQTVIDQLVFRPSAPK